MKQYQQEDQDFSNFSEVLMVWTNNELKVQVRTNYTCTRLLLEFLFFVDVQFYGKCIFWLSSVLEIATST